LFNIIGIDIYDSSFLDLFAGTGSVGIEALSRGASFARFLDIQQKAIETIHRNLKVTSLETNAEVIKQDAFQYLLRLVDRRFEYIYIAPPQYKNLWLKALACLDENLGWMANDGWVIVQIHPVEDQETNLQNLEEFDRRKYGSTLLVFYQKR
jgi:16S rRNA (guanine(966)-N(2))-methyltransferase RsmD